MGVSLVDRDRPGITADGLAARQRAAISASQRRTAAGQWLRDLRSVCIPGEARGRCLFEAADEAAVAALTQAAGLPFTRIGEALDLTP